MTLSVALLAHKDLNRVAELARFLSNSGLRICIHIDLSVSAERFDALKISLSGQPNIIWAKRVECEWGHFSLVQATLNISEKILKTWPNTGHVLLLSGDTLPTRATSELTAFLVQNPDVDFIESVSADDNNWIAGGLGAERFTLTFPFSWKKQRWLFDKWVDVQRRLGLKTRVPAGLRPHIGSQWWCLTRQTLNAILNDPNKQENDAYFRKCWIPDESYFQTLARKHAHTIVSRSFLFSRFDHQGKPTAFYDDHIEDIGAIDAYFVRKVWPGASVLYQHYLGKNSLSASNDALHAQTLQHIEMTANRRKVGRSGLHMHGCAPSQWYKNHAITAAPYYVFTNFSSLFPDFNTWIEAQTGVQPHGRLFAKNRAQFAGNATIVAGGISDNTAIRDLAPESFLSNLVWNTRETGLAFHYETDDTPTIQPFLLSDPNAHLLYIRHGWVMDLMNQNITREGLLKTLAQSMITLERAFLTALNATNTACHPHIRTLGEVLADPLPTLAAALGNTEKGPLVLPTMADASDLLDFASNLKNIGVDIDLELLEAPAVDIQVGFDLQAQK